MTQNVPEGMSPGSDTANLAVLGYNPKVYYSGRSPMEALSIGVPMKETDVSLRCNLVTLSEGGSYETKKILDHSSGEISTEDAKILLEAVKKQLESETYHFYSGTSYRHLTIWENGKMAELTPPHDILEKVIGDYLPKEEALKEMMKRSYDILNEHPLNLEREKKGLAKANSIWFWGPGTKPALDSFEKKYGKKGVMISAVDLLKGIGVAAGMKNIIVEGANGGLHTNYRGKAMAAVKALAEDGYDLAYIHVEAPDEMGHQGSVEKKIEAIEHLDKEVTKVVVDGLKGYGEQFRILLLPDHPTPVHLRTHTANPVPYLLYDSTKEQKKSGAYSEKEAAKTGIVEKDGYRLMNKLLGGSSC
jgi:2,3-bisphosphoglycerate-independent phosphoglycerate mutase